MKAGKLTVKHQVTIPRDVRVALGLKAGDHVVFAIEDGQAVLTKVEKPDPEEEAWFRFTMSQMTEWASPEDDEAFRDL
ncbi:AbrB/MazE/SpoVT family DNA-binding domain-containing protein [Sphingobium algorifonticola]|uniref:AbrB/MazE/SpoVT family DNA-binding domain-containing protein n=1 Tax=Sphingobium algorifonticola TaxID=2008318 RepID=A0A437J8G8_9SPHN|nr:type II toxin-antitoxin system PrlF family antitoxin [Sphingobium algorifonticola]RVT41796.1 AbrB/MazE/SpoVT family DNA-binding domain-containing protein [Sphingobium algorifonticola]